jgi:carboxypeptidase Taq
MSNTSKEKYQSFVSAMQKAADFNNAAAVLGWDQEVMMPPKGFEFRGRQLATLAAHAHELVTNDTFGALLKGLLAANDLNENETANVKLSYEDYCKNTKLSSAFVEKLSEQTSKCYAAWIDARRKNNFSVFQPSLQEMIELKRQEADLLGYETHPYNALLDAYEKGATVKQLDAVFETVKNELPALLHQIQSCKQVDDGLFSQPFDKQQQFNFTLDVLRKMGYDFDAGRQDFSEHPFSTSFAPTDARITTRANENDLSSIIWSSIHEGGHALYEQGLPTTQYGMPLGAAVSLSIHESQSRLWENCVGRSLGFWGHFYPVLQNYFPKQLAQYSAEDFYKAANKVAPSLIRTEADELTYHFHVMIRYEIEKELIAGSLNAHQLSEVWNESYRKNLGISSDDDLKGVLQDVHWSHGSFGYFPTYSLGSFYAAQFFEQALKDLPALEKEIEEGQFENLVNWLRNNVHQHGRKYTSEALCTRITGRGLDFHSFMKYATNKFTKIYVD